MQTYTGRKFFPTSPNADDICIADIAHALSLHCRFNGHTRVFYSVAEHSVRVSNMLPDSLRLWGLMHDSAEAYTGDIIRPIKMLLPDAEAMEDAILRVIADKYGLSWPMPAEVHMADDIVLMTEKRDIMGQSPHDWEIQIEPLPGKIEPWTAESSEAAFLDKFRELSGS